jgi:glycosyltransferase involved in cell wall biosynthesis
VPHGVDPGRFPLDPEARPVPGRIVYCGTIGMGHAVGTLVDAARILDDDGARFELLLVGDGAERPELEARARGLRGVVFAGRRPRDELPALLASAEIAVATQRDAPLLADALSTKVLEYMAAARPVVVAASGWTADVVERAGAGLVCPPEQPAALAAAITRLRDDPTGARAMGLAGRRYVEANLTRAVAVDRLERTFTSLTAARPPRAGIRAWRRRARSSRRGTSG